MMPRALPDIKVNATKGSRHAGLLTIGRRAVTNQSIFYHVLAGVTGARVLRLPIRRSSHEHVDAAPCPFCARHERFRRGPGIRRPAAAPPRPLQRERAPGG